MFFYYVEQSCSSISKLSILIVLLCKEIIPRSCIFFNSLDKVNIEARYPTFKDTILKSLNQTRCEILINETKELFQWIKNQL
ncbi:MAG: HEPN domain-containing protein [Dethiobacter sp.]|nr:HEPN domain-containing protein [Dethiobacter sp.]